MRRSMSKTPELQEVFSRYRVHSDERIFLPVKKLHFLM